MSIQPHSRWFWMMVVLQFNYNFYVVVERDKYQIYLYHHFDQKSTESFFYFLKVFLRKLFKTVKKLILTFIWEEKGIRIVKKLKKNKVRGHILLDFNTYYKAIVIMKVWYWQKDRYKRSTEQNNEPRNKYTNIVNLYWQR